MERVSMPPYTKVRTVTLYRDKMTTEIDSITYKLGETSVADGTVRDSISSDTEDSLDGNIIANLMDAREAQLRKRLEAFLKKEEILEVSNNPDQEESYVFTFCLPEDFNDSRLRPIAKVMNDYIVKGTLLDWYSRSGTAFGADLVQEVGILESRAVDLFREGFVLHPTMIYFPSHKIR